MDSDHRELIIILETENCAAFERWILQNLDRDPAALMKFRTGDSCESILHLVIYFKSIPCLETLLRFHESLDFFARTAKMQQSVLHLACTLENMSLQIIRRLVEAEPRLVTAVAANNVLPIHLAVQYKRLDIVRLLIETGKSPVNCRNSFRETPLHYAAFLVEYSVRYSFQNVTYDSENLEIIRYLVPRAKALKDMQCKTALQIVEDTVLECDETEIVASGRYLRDCLEVMKSTEKDFTFIFKLFFLAVKSRDLHSASQFVEAYADPKLNSKAEFVRQLKSFIEEPDLCLLLTIHDKFDHKWLHEYIKSLSRSDFYFEALIHVFSQFFDSPEKQELITKLVREIQHAGVDFASWKLAKKFSQIPTDLELQKILNIFKALFDLRLGVNFNAAAIEFIYSFCSNPTTEPFLIELLLPFTSHIFIDHYCFLDDLNIETYRDDTHQQHLQFFQRLSQLSDYFTLTCCHKLENSSMHFAYRVHSLKHISRNAIRECIFNRRLLTDNEFVESIMRLPIPMVLKKYLRYLDELQFLKI